MAEWNLDKNITQEKQPGVILSPKETSEIEKQKLENKLNKNRKIEEEKLIKKIEKYKDKLWEDDKSWLAKLAKLEYDEAINRIDWYWKELKKLWEEKNIVWSYIVKETDEKLKWFVSEFKNDLFWITKILENKKYFGNSYSIFTKILRDPKNNSFWEWVYDVFIKNDVSEKLKAYTEINWNINIENISDIRKLLKILTTPIVEKKEENLENKEILSEEEKEFNELYKKLNNLNKNLSYEKIIIDLYELDRLANKIEKKDFRDKYLETEKWIIIYLKADEEEIKADEENARKWYKDTFWEDLDISKERGLDSINKDKLDKKIKLIESLIGINDKFTNKWLQDFKDFAAWNLKLDDAKAMLRQFSNANIKKAIKESLDNAPKINDIINETTWKVEKIVSVVSVIDAELKAKELKKNLINLFWEKRVDELYRQVETEIEIERLNKAKILPEGKTLLVVMKKANVYKDEKGAYSVWTKWSNTGFSIPVDIQWIDEKKEKIESDFKDDNVALFERREDIDRRINELKEKEWEKLSREEQVELTELEEELEWIDKEIEDKEKAKDEELKEVEEKILKENNEKIEKAARIAKFLEKIGWDLIPERKREILLSELKVGNIIIDKSLKINPNNIDINNGVFWEKKSTNWDWSWNLWEKTFAKMMNKIITGRVDWVYRNEKWENKIFINIDSIGQDVSSSSDLWNNWGYTRSHMVAKMKENWMYDTGFTLVKVKKNLSKDGDIENIDNKIFKKTNI